MGSWELTLLKSRKLLSTIPRKLDNLSERDLSAEEVSLFGRFTNSGYYTGIPKNTGIPNNVSVSNIGADTPYILPLLAGIYTLNPTRVPGLWDVKYGSNSILPDDVVKQQIITDIKRLQIVGKGPSNPEFVVYSGHVPFQLSVPAQAVADGFSKKRIRCRGREIRGIQALGGMFMTRAFFGSLRSITAWNSGSYGCWEMLDFSGAHAWIGVDAFLVDCSLYGVFAC